MPLRGKCTTWNQAVQVHMPGQGLAPGMEHRGHAQLTIQTFGIGAEVAQGCPHGLEQQGIDFPIVDLHPGIEYMGQGEDQMVIGHRQHRRALTSAPVIRCAPLTARTVTVAAGMISRLLLGAVIRATATPRCTKSGCRSAPIGRRQGPGSVP